MWACEFMDFQCSAYTDSIAKNTYKRYTLKNDILAEPLNIAINHCVIVLSMVFNVFLYACCCIVYFFYDESVIYIQGLIPGSEHIHGFPSARI